MRDLGIVLEVARELVMRGELDEAVAWRRMRMRRKRKRKRRMRMMRLLLLWGPLVLLFQVQEVHRHH